MDPSVEMEKLPEMVSAAVVLSVLRCCCCFFCLLAAPRAVVVSADPTPTVCANSGEASLLLRSDQIPRSATCAFHFRSILVFVAAGTPPVMLGEPLRFCGNTGISCCDAVDDDALREELDAMNVPDATCAAIVKSFLCAVIFFKKRH